VAFWVVAPCSVVDWYQSFGEASCLCLQGSSWKRNNWENYEVHFLITTILRIYRPFPL